MQIQELFESLLEESASPIIYHITNMRAAIRILKENQFRLSVVSSKKEHDLSSGKRFYLSTARTLSSWFLQHHTKTAMSSVRFQLNGRTLNHNHKAVPVDFYSSVDGSGHESEDRIISDKPTIENAARFIERVDVLTTDEYDQLLELYRASKGIPVFVYQDQQSFLVARRGTPIKEFLGL